MRRSRFAPEGPSLAGRILVLGAILVCCVLALSAIAHLSEVVSEGRIETRFCRRFTCYGPVHVYLLSEDPVGFWLQVVFRSGHAAALVAFAGVVGLWSLKRSGWGRR